MPSPRRDGRSTWAKKTAAKRCRRQDNYTEVGKSVGNERPYQSKVSGALAARRKLWASSSITPALMMEFRVKAAWVSTMLAMALDEVITTTRRHGGDHLQHGSLPLCGPRHRRGDFHAVWINPPLYPANVAPVSFVSPGQKNRRRQKPGAAASIQHRPIQPVGGAISSRPFCLASGPSCVTAPAAITSTMARHTNTVVRP